MSRLFAEQTRSKHGNGRPRRSEVRLPGQVVSYGCGDEWPQASQLETARFYPLRVLEVRSLTWVLLTRNQGAGTFWKGQRSIWVPTRWGLVAARPGW